MKASCSLDIDGRILAEIKKNDDDIKTLEKVDSNKENIDRIKPESLMMPQVLSKPLGIVSHSSGRHTQSVPLIKKYLPFQFLLESGISDTSLSDFFWQ